MYSDHGQHIWDEFEWESHINEMTRRHEHLRDLIESDHEDRPRWMRHLKEYPTKLDAVDAFIEEELLIEESHFPIDEDEPDDEYSDEELLDLFENEDAWDPDEEDEEELEEELEEEFDESEADYPDHDGPEFIFSADGGSYPASLDYASLENIAIYTDARDLAADLLIFNDSKPEYLRHSGFVQLVSSTLMISSKLAAAYSMGFDLEVLGANICYCKKGLQKANRTLEDLQRLKDNPLTPTDYYEIHRRLFEIRNNLGIHIQETRTFFNRQF